MEFYYFCSSHWDREWYRPFQYFRGMLLENAEKILDVLENDPAFQCFVFDGQTIVLEDITEIRPDWKERLKEQIGRGRLKIGPWYLMPDELLPSGEALIRNLLRGRRIAGEYGVDPWPVGYLPDTFGHIAQMPQILREFGMEIAVGWRGIDETLPPFLRWAAPDGSVCRLLHLPYSGYGDFSFVRMEKDFDTAFRKMVERERAVYGETFLLSDAFDHQEIPADAPAVLRRIGELYPDARIHWTDFTDPVFRDLSERLPLVRGEQICTCRGVRSSGIQIPATLSSRVDLKLANDGLQNTLELEMEPAAVHLREEFSRNLRGMLDLAWKLCLQNQPHDSICGCSVDAVHAVMASRTAEAHQICDYLRDQLILQDRTALTGELMGGYSSAEDGRCTLRVFNPLPFSRQEVFSIPVEFIGETYPAMFAEPRSSESRNAFHLFTENGEEIPYAVTEIQRNVRKSEYRQKYRTFQIYTLTAELRLKAHDWTTFRIEPAGRPVRYFGSLRTGSCSAENEFLALEILPDGRFNVRDKRSGRICSGLNNFLIDRESGDGWGHVRPLCSTELIASSRAQTVVTEDNSLRTVFEITRFYELPEEVLFGGTVNAAYGATRLSDHRRSLCITSRITLSRNSPELRVVTSLHNTIRDCRLRLRIPTGIPGSWFASQAFVFLDRAPGRESGDETRDFRETEPLEKNFSGIAGKRDAGGGIAILSAGGLHEISGTESGDLLVTLFRAFRRTVGTEGETDGELQRDLRFDYAYRFFSRESNADLHRHLLLLRTQPIAYTLCSAAVRAENPHTALLSLEGALSFSALKPAEDGSGNIILRLVNLSGEPGRAAIRLSAPHRITECTMAETPGALIAEQSSLFSVELPPWKTGTFRIS